ncbi:MAG: nucleotidyltransferase family protein [Armatimonadetes bacterium]|nr:nucleotidyltransferase family protein [Armatimonadota bacterium]
MATAILLETDKLDDALSGRAGAPGLLPAAGRPLVDYAARALAACGDVERVVLAGPTAYGQHAVATTHCDETLLLDDPVRTLVESLLERYGDCEELLLWRPNAPLLTTEMVEHFLAHAPAEAAVTVALVRAERVEAEMPDLPPVPTTALGPDNVTFTPLMVIRPAALANHHALLSRLVADSMAQAELVKTLGVGFSIKLKAGRARLDEVARRVSEVIGSPCVLQVAPHAELAVRVRTRAEYHWVRERLESA